MGYPQEISLGAIIQQASIATAHNVGTAATGGVWANAVAAYPFYVQKYFFQVSTAINDATAGVVSLNKITVGNVTSEIASIIIPNGTAAKKVLYKDFSPVKIGVGDTLMMKMKTQAGQGGTPVGAGFHGYLASFQPEVLTNETNAIVSA